MTVDLRRGAPRRRVMKRGLYLAPFDELANPRLLAELLSNGRLTLGVGLGNTDDLGPYGEAIDPRERAPAG